MELTDLEALKDYILAQNPYFQKGFANAFKVRNVGSDSNSKVFSRDKSGDLVVVSPQDTFGNYFYLKNETGITYRAAYAITGTDTVYEETINIAFVAFLKEGDNMKVANNIKNTLMMYNKCSVRAIPVNVVWNREQIIIEELAGISDDDIAAALQRLGSWTVVKLNFQFIKPSEVSRCIEDICSVC